MIQIAPEAPTDPAFVSRVRIRAQRLVALGRRFSLDLSVPNEQPPADVGEAHPRVPDSEPNDSDLSRDIVTADAAFVADRVWSLLAADFALSQSEVDLLSLVLAAHIDPQLGHLYALLQGDPARPYPTVGLAAALFEWDRTPPLWLGSSLVSWGLAHPVDSGGESWARWSGWVADPAISSWVLGGPAMDTDLAGGLHFLDADAACGLCLYPAELALMREYVRSIRLAGSACSIEIEILGQAGAGRRTLASQLASSWGLRVLFAETASLFPADLPTAAARERSRRCIRSARLENALLCWEMDDTRDAPIWNAANPPTALSLFVGERPMGGGSRPGCQRLTVRLGALHPDQQHELWSSLSDQPLPGPLSAWTLTPAQLRVAAEAAPNGEQAQVDACRRSVHYGLEELLTPLPCPYSWRDIVLEPSLERHLREFEDQASLRWAVLREWGFERLTPLSTGINAMLSGPSGTGKTMAAQVVARSLDMELLRVDLAGLVNKYIGETEKRLKRVFDACERANVVLLFDEADALFGRRTQVKDAHDRFANIEIDYLLQRMERFDGIAILATNRRSDVDQAFLRRLRFVIDFTPPGFAERLVLWKLALPLTLADETPLLEDINFEQLADRVKLTGAGIKSAAIAAAFLAKSEGSRISMKHVMHAARRELAKSGLELRAEQPTNA